MRYWSPGFLHNPSHDLKSTHKNLKSFWSGTEIRHFVFQRMSIICQQIVTAWAYDAYTVCSGMSLVRLKIVPA
jgi:hypothetical protein